MLAEEIIKISRLNQADKPVTTALYLVAVVMNEDDPNVTNQDAVEAFAAEFQSALDDGFFTNLRYDAMNFNVMSRVVLDVAPGNEAPVPRGAPGCTCGTPPFAPPEASDDCPYHGTEAV